jgi:hypothetical protein
MNALKGRTHYDLCVHKRAGSAKARDLVSAKPDGVGPKVESASPCMKRQREYEHYLNVFGLGNKADHQLNLRSRPGT